MRKRVRVILKRTAITVGLLLAIYTAIVLVGLIPVNNDFQPTPTGVKIWVVSSEVHADFLLPLDETSVVDWRQQFPISSFAGDVSEATHVAIGWGDKRFYLETPTWSDLTVSAAVHALLLPSESCLHVYMTVPARLVEPHPVTISREQYRELVAYINSSFQSDKQGRRMQIAEQAYGQNDAFYEAVGTYSCINTCNAWVGRGLKRAGVRVPWLSLLPTTVLWYLP